MLDRSRICLFFFMLMTGTPLVAVEILERVVNNGNLVLQDISVIPDQIVADLNRYQNVRSAGFLGWTQDGKSLYVRTRFGDVAQIHAVSAAGGARTQLTFFDAPIGAVSRQPGGRNFIFTMATGGSEFTQIFLFDPLNGREQMLTDGHS